MFIPAGEIFLIVALDERRRCVNTDERDI